MSSTPSISESTSTDTPIGPFVAELRQARKLSYNDVSARIKYSVRQLKALEAEDWSALPTGMPLRWMIKSYARYLETDEGVLLGLLEKANPDARAPHHMSQSYTNDVRKGAGWSDSEMPLHDESSPRSWGWGWIAVIFILVVVAFFYALDQGWVPEEWLVFDWLKGFSS